MNPLNPHNDPCVWEGGIVIGLIPQMMEQRTIAVEQTDQVTQPENGTVGILILVAWNSSLCHSMRMKQKDIIAC